MQIVQWAHIPPPRSADQHAVALSRTGDAADDDPVQAPIVGTIGDQAVRACWPNQAPPSSASQGRAAAIRHGIPALGVSTLRYFWRERSHRAILNAGGLLQREMPQTIRSMVTNAMPDQQKATLGRCFIACLIAGVAMSPLATLLWPLVGLIYYGDFSGDIEVTLTGLTAVAFFGLIGGLVIALLIGFPLLIIAEHIGVNRAPVLAATGAAISLLFGLFVASWPKGAWALYLFMGTLGASCGALASLGSRSAGIRNGERACT